MDINNRFPLDTFAGARGARVLVAVEPSSLCYQHDWAVGQASRPLHRCNYVAPAGGRQDGGQDLQAGGLVSGPEKGEMKLWKPNFLHRLFINDVKLIWLQNILNLWKPHVLRIQLKPILLVNDVKPIWIKNIWPTLVPLFSHTGGFPGIYTACHVGTNKY